MPTPIHLRQVPDHVEIPELPKAMDAWFELVKRSVDKVTRWKRQEIDIDYVVDGLSAAHALSGYRYSRRNGRWTDEAGDEPGQWRREWIVIAMCEGDPFIADISRPSIPVLLAEHGIGEWKPKQVHRRLRGFIKAIKVTEPRPVPEYVPSEPYPRDSSLSVLDWGPEREKLIAALVERHSYLYQPHMFRNKIDTPVVLTRRMTRWSAEQVRQIISNHGGKAEIGPAIPKQPKSPA